MFMSVCVCVHINLVCTHMCICTHIYACLGVIECIFVLSDFG